MRLEEKVDDFENRARKANLAKLLATENISVVHKNIPTAYFDVENRVLGLPNWDNASKDVFDLLVGHEVGHALYTPNNKIEDFINEVDSENAKAVHSFINVIEDARIERKIKRKFAGLRKNFYNGYKELLERDFFGLNERDISTYSLIDRINVHYKVGSLVDVPFFDDEKNWLDKIDSAETFESVLDIVKSLYNSESSDSETDESYSPDGENSDDVKYDGDDGDNDLSDSKSGGEDFDVETSNSGVGTEENESGDDGDSSGVSSGDDDGEIMTKGIGREGKPFGAETESSLADSIADEFVNENSIETFYGTIPDIDSSEYIRPISKVHETLSFEFASPTHTEGYRKFKKSATKTVNYLVKEFELKKNAEQLARASVSKTGVIDINKLHSYKFNEDLFKRVTTVPNGKNHGLVMFVDWSSSFAESIGSGLERIIEMVLFCRKINIPFDVYGFSDSVLHKRWREEGITLEDVREEMISKFKKGDIICNEFELMHLLSSTVKTKTLDEHLKNIYSLAKGFGKFYWGNVNGFSLGGTPLNDAILVANDVIAKFRKKYGVEIINTVFVTDGESNSIAGIRKDDNRSHGFGTGSWYRCESSIVEDKVTGKSYTANTRIELTNALLEALSDRHNVNTIGYFIGNRPKDCVDAIRLHGNFDRWSNDYKPLIKELNAKKFVSLKHSGYTEFFVIKGGKDLEVDGDGFTIEDGASKRKMTTAFKKHAKSKLENRVMLSRFIDLIA